MVKRHTPLEAGKAEHPSCPPQRRAQSPSSSFGPGGNSFDGSHFQLSAGLKRQIWMLTNSWKSCL